MLRSKSSRSAFSDLGNKSNQSVLSRTFSSSKFCRGDNLGKSVNWNVHKIFVKRRSLDRIPSKSGHITESQIMQEHRGQIEEELKWAKERIFVVEEERRRAIDDIKDAKRVAYEKANLKVDVSVGELMNEIKNLKVESRIKNKSMENLRKEVEHVKHVELKFNGSEAFLSILKEELNKSKESETMALNELLSCKKQMEDLKDEVERRKASEAKLLDSLHCQTQQLEESKFKIASLSKKVLSLGSLLKQNDENYVQDDEIIEFEFSKPESTFEEVDSLRNELGLALQAEEKSKKAMDDLALALKEVATESNQAKEKAHVTELELEYVKTEAEQLKRIIRSTQERYEKLLDEAKNEAEMYKNTSDRLRLEAEETLLAWNGKEMGFISCIKRAEEERAVTIHENNKITKSLQNVEHTSRLAKDECSKLRDILKQAINEANASKAAASIARDENSQLKDCLYEKDEALQCLAQENERLRISETAAYENIKAFKRVLSKTSSTTLKDQEEQDGMLMKLTKQTVNDSKEDIKVRKTFSFDIDAFNPQNDIEDSDETKDDRDPRKVDALKGSIFDHDGTLSSESQTPNLPTHHRRASSSIFTDDGETTNSDDLDHLDDPDSDRNHRRRKTMFQRVGSLIMRKSFQRKEPTPNTPPA